MLTLYTPHVPQEGRTPSHLTRLMLISQCTDCSAGSVPVAAIVTSLLDVGAGSLALSLADRLGLAVCTHSSKVDAIDGTSGMRYDSQWRRDKKKESG
jgi:hypothetical protein